MFMSLLSPRALTVIATVALVQPALNAAVVSGTSNGYALDAHVQALGVVNLNAGPAPAGVIGTAPAPYNLSDSTANLNVVAGIPFVVSGSVTAGLLSATATSNIDGLPGPRTTGATASLDNASVGVTTFLGAPLLSLNATATSSASITGDVGSLVATGNVTFQELSLTINSIPVDLSAFVGVAVAPNTGVDLSLLGLANVTLILNEQSVAPDHSSITVNALNLDLNLLGVVTGDVVLGHAEASVVAVPEPATMGLLAGSALVLMRRRRANA